MKKKHHQGVTLIELMIVVVVVGILAAVALPSYQDSVRKGRRSDGQAALLDASQILERFYTENMSYSGAPLSAVTPQQFYTISFDSAPTSGTVCGTIASTTANASAYRLCATPVGAQAADSCGILSLSHTGLKTPTTCW